MTCDVFYSIVTSRYSFFLYNKGRIVSVMEENTAKSSMSISPSSMPSLPWPGTSNGRKLRWIISKRLIDFP